MLLSRNLCHKRVRVNFRNFHTTTRHCAMHNFTAATIFSQIFRQINVLLKNLTVNQFDEKKLRGSEFLVFPHFELNIVENTTDIYSHRKNKFVKSTAFIQSWTRVVLQVY